MSTRVPSNPKIYHIVHVDRLASIIADSHLFSDADIAERSPDSTTIGLDAIKQRRLHELRLSSHPDIYVGECVPGVKSQQTYQKAMTAVALAAHRPRIEVRRDWYY